MNLALFARTEDFIIPKTFRFLSIVETLKYQPCACTFVI